jgi:DNA polymerase
MCIAMYHPAAGLHQASLKDVIRQDFKKIPLVIAEAERMATEASSKPAAPAKKDEPPQQLSLF